MWVQIKIAKLVGEACYLRNKWKSPYICQLPAWTYVPLCVGETDPTGSAPEVKQTALGL